MKPQKSLCPTLRALLSDQRAGVETSLAGFKPLLCNAVCFLNSAYIIVLAPATFHRSTRYPTVSSVVAMMARVRGRRRRCLACTVWVSAPERERQGARPLPLDDLGAPER